MNHYYALLICVLCLVFQSPAQLVDCDCDNRYSIELFNDVNVETVTYSNLYNLQMDIYTPYGDNCTNRPLIILAHGGSFIGGSKSNPTMVDLCETFAKRGYVAASINYRLATHSTVLGFNLPRICPQKGVDKLITVSIIKKMNTPLSKKFMKLLS